MSSKKKKKAAGSPAWMTTYADMTTLLLAFFILLFSFSALDVQKFQQVMTSLQVTFLGERGVLETGSIPLSPTEEWIGVDPEIDITEEIMEIVDEFQQTFLALQAYLEEAGLDDQVKIRLEERGIVLEIADAILFDTARVDLRPESLELMGMLGDVLVQMPNRVIVEGHTDNVPINRPMFPSNWELSVLRATSVARYFIEVMDMAPSRFVASGYGEFQPVDTNLTAEGRANNRRVNIVISAVERIREEG